MAATQDHTWEQGEDLIVEIVYKVNDAGVPMTTETHAVRMDIAPLTGAVAGTPVYSFNSDDLVDAALDAPGDADNEILFPTDPPGTIHIIVPRALTLPGGVIGDALGTTTTTYVYDMFVRDKTQGTNGTQKKLLKGKIVVNSSVTLWV